MKYIIIDARTEKALYGIGQITLQFTSREIAKEVADQFFVNPDFYMIVPINIPEPPKN